MDVGATTATVQQPGVNRNSTDRSVSSDFTTFLTLLTTQLKNQDPLKPLDSTEFVAQLASFSAVEQQVKTNDALAMITELLGGPGASGLTAWVGAEVRALKPADFSGSPVNIFVTSQEGADRVQLVVKNAAGETVQTLPLALPFTSDILPWAGVDPSGTPFANGQYHFSIESFQGSTLLETHQAPIYDEVREARVDNGQIVLQFGDGTTMLADDIVAVRARGLTSE